MREDQITPLLGITVADGRKPTITCSLTAMYKHELIRGTVAYPIYWSISSHGKKYLEEHTHGKP